MSPKQVDVIESALQKVDRPGFDPDDIAAEESLLVGFASTHAREDPARLARQVVDVTTRTARCRTTSCWPTGASCSCGRPRTAASWASSA